jgi:putative membrane protein
MPPTVARKPLPAVIGLSAILTGFLIWLIYFKARVAEPPWVLNLPAANATFNALSATCLVFGYVNIRRNNRITHMRFMISAAIFSALFLASYVTYHAYHGDTHFPGHGTIAYIYFFILGTHILLSMVALPLILLTLWFAAAAQFRLHRKVARWTFPIWLYVSATGVLVFFILHAYTT